MTVWCKHFRSIMEGDACKIGIAYADVRDTNWPGSLPCFNEEIETCSQRDWPSAEEIAAHEAEVAAMVEKFVQDLANDICPHCEQQIDRYQQVGRCVYARPCGHRLYQGRIPKEKRA